MELAFVKMHGLGNDFVVIEDLEGVIDLSAQQISFVCDRHGGVGADGVILIRRAPDHHGFYMHYHNADGSLAETCGNGLRCFAKYLVERGLVEDDVFIAYTLAGPKEIRVGRTDDGTMTWATVDMGSPVFTPTEIPIDLDVDLVQGYPIETPVGTFLITAVSMGNPHAIVFVDDVLAAPVGTVGPCIENHEIFPKKANVGFAEVCGEERICLRVWERGVGETLACGTGACAAVVAASLDCAIGREAVVVLRGGELTIRWEEDGHVSMTGPAEVVFAGSITL